MPFSKGKLTKVDNGFSKTECTAFDNLGRVKKSKQTTDNTAYNEMLYSYNLSGALMEQTYPSGRVVKNTLGQDGNLAQVQSAKAGGTLQNYANSFNYTAAGAVSAMRLGNGRWENTQFNSRLQPVQIGLGTSATSQNLLKLNYEYGATASVNNGNITKQTISVPPETRNNVTYAAFTATQNYTYDALNRLKDATENIPGQTNPNWKQTFIYDRFGNRTFDTANGNTTTLAPGCQTNVCNPSANPANNRLVGTTYDNAGNTTTDGGGTGSGNSFVYDAENKQVQVSNASGVIGQYFYDGDGKRVKKIVYTNNTPAETTIFVYDASGKMVAEYSTVTADTPKISYLTNDTLGSPRITTDANGAVISRRDFMPFGEEITRAGYSGDNVRQKFTSYERDNETELDFAQARYYNKNLGRFNSTDPLYFQFMMVIDPQRFNLYGYSRNNPLKFVDPEGEKVLIRGSGQTLLYDMAGGQESFDATFQVVDGQVNLREDIDKSKLTEGQQELLGLIDSTDNYLVYSGNDGAEAAALFKDTVDNKGKVIQGARKRADEFTGNNKERAGGSLVGTTGRDGGTLQPANLANGDPVFCVIAFNTDAVFTQTGLGGTAPLTIGDALEGASEVKTAQENGLGQVIKPGSYFTHEVTENREFSRIGASNDNYTRAHSRAMVREATIRREMKITGGFSGGAVTRRVPKK